MDGTQLSPLLSRKGMAWSLRPFTLSLLFLLPKTTKMENNRRVGPASLCDLDKERSSAFKSSLPDLSRGANASSFLAQSFLLFPLVRLGWPLC